MTAKLQIGASTRSVSLHRRELARARWLASTDTAWTGVEFSVQETTSPLTGIQRLTSGLGRLGICSSVCISFALSGTVHGRTRAAVPSWSGMLAAGGGRRCAVLESVSRGQPARRPQNWQFCSAQLRRTRQEHTAQSRRYVRQIFISPNSVVTLCNSSNGG